MAAAGPACHGQIFNVGNSPAITLREIAILLTRAEGSFCVRDMPPCRAGIDIGSFATDDSVFRAATGWSPTMPLALGLDLTLEWFRSRLRSYV
jgi:nucleoside-diphosphate-sugar epimerase